MTRGEGLGDAYAATLSRMKALLEINPFRLFTIYFPFPLDGKRDYD